MKLNTSPRVHGDPFLARELREHAQQVNAVSEGRLAAFYTAQTAAPTTGTYAVGDFIRNSAPADSGAAGNKHTLHGWLCVASGTPGTWVQARYMTADVGSGGGISDGDKGDVTVSGSGATWTIDNDAVTYAKMQNVSATNRLLGRSTSGAGDVEEITLGANLSFAGAVLNAASGSASFASAEVNLGSIPSVGGTFTVTGSGMTAGKPVNIWQAVGPYTDKGSLADECEMDGLTARGIVVDATTIRVYWNSATRVRGYVKFNYLIGA